MNPNLLLGTPTWGTLAIRHNTEENNITKLYECRSIKWINKSRPLRNAYLTEDVPPSIERSVFQPRRFDPFVSI